jgi:DNA repair protein RadD
MGFTLRPYQQEAVDAVVEHIRRRLSPCLLELATGAGKSLIVAELAAYMAKAAPNKRVLCIAPSRELVEQNAEKFQAYGYQTSIYCASAGSKCLRHQVIFASPQTALKSIDKIAHMGVSAIICDEAHGITKSMLELIKRVQEYELSGQRINELLRVIGMTATPYRMGTGYIYAADYTMDPPLHYDEEKAIDPYYSRLVYRVAAGELVAQGFLTKPVIGEDAGEHYDTSTLEMDRMGRFSAQSTALTFEKSTKTKTIIEKVVSMSVGRMGVMIFAATISHAEEIAGYLPQDQAAVVTGSTKKKDREAIIQAFKARKLRYLVNVSVLTTGFDAPHVDVVAILRATESAGLLQQIIGRGLRLHDNKADCLVLDYAENIKRHGLESDVFTPEIKTRKASGEAVEIQVECPACHAISMKKRRNDPMYTGLAHDRFGNFLVSGTERVVATDADGDPCEWDGMVLTTRVIDPSTKDDFGDCDSKEVPVPAHYSRRCSNPEAAAIKGVAYPCTHRFSFKMCPDCLAENDIAARHCTECKIRLVDPNEKLTEKAGVAGKWPKARPRTCCALI